MTATLYKIAKRFNKEGITWALGGRVILLKYGVIDRADDIELVVTPKDLSKVNEILLSLGVKQPPLSKYYLNSYEIDEVDVSVICGLKIKSEDEIYSYQFDQMSITDSNYVARIKTYYTCLEDWYVIYSLMGDQSEYVSEIEKYFILHKVVNKALLARTLADVPHDLKLKIKFSLNL